MNKRLLIICGVQNDFFTEPFGSTRLKEILPKIRAKIENWDGDIIVVTETRLTEDQIRDGLACHPDQVSFDRSIEKNEFGIAVHCIKWTEDWELAPELLDALRVKNDEKLKFRTVEGYSQTWHDWANNISTYDDIEICGTKTSSQILSTVCAIRAVRPEVSITVLKDLCSDVEREWHREALSMMMDRAVVTEEYA